VITSNAGDRLCYGRGLRASGSIRVATDELGWLGHTPMKSADQGPSSIGRVGPPHTGHAVGSAMTVVGTAGQSHGVWWQDGHGIGASGLTRIAYAVRQARSAT
jgi:hypothetical protein